MQFSYLRKSTLLGTIRPQRVHYLERLGVIGDSLAFQADYFEKTSVGQTFEIKLLGKVGYFTKDPKNLEAMLSTRFEGESLAGILIGSFHRISNCIFHVLSRLGSWITTSRSFPHDRREHFYSGIRMGRLGNILESYCVPSLCEYNTKM
jgi:hypothetical protein